MKLTEGLQRTYDRLQRDAKDLHYTLSVEKVIVKGAIQRLPPDHYNTICVRLALGGRLSIDQVTGYAVVVYRVGAHRRAYTSARKKMFMTGSQYFIVNSTTLVFSTCGVSESRRQIILQVAIELAAAEWHALKEARDATFALVAAMRRRRGAVLCRDVRDMIGRTFKGLALQRASDSLK